MGRATPIPEGYFAYRVDDRWFIMCRVIKRADGEIDSILPINDTRNHNIRKPTRKLIAEVAQLDLAQEEWEQQKAEAEKAREEAEQAKAELEAVKAELEALRGKRLVAAG